MIVLLLTLSIVATTSALALGQTIKIGASVAWTGSLSREGRLLKEGYAFWADHINQSGGILVGGKRHTVQLVVYDDESNAATSQRLTEKLITQDKVQFLLGPYSSPITLETSLIGEKHKILTIAAMANADAIYERRFKYVASVLPPATAYMKRFLEMARKFTPQPNTVAILAVGSAFGICPKMLALTLGPEFPDFAKSLGKDADYVYGSAWWLPNMGWKGHDFGSSQDYARAMAKRTGREPTYHEAGGTAAGLFLHMAIEKANSLDTDAVRAAFGTIDTETSWGPVAWNDTGQNIKGASGPLQIQNGKIVSIYPEHLREAPPVYPMPCWNRR